MRIDKQPNISTEWKIYRSIPTELGSNWRLSVMDLSINDQNRIEYGKLS